MLSVFKHIENQVKQNIFNKTKLSEWLHRFSYDSSWFIIDLSDIT